MSWTLTHRFLTAAGRPASGWVYFAVVPSPVLTDVATFTSTADRVKLDKTGAFTVNGLPSEPDLFLQVYPRIVNGEPQSFGPVSVPMQPDGATVDLDELITEWPTTSTAPFATRAEVAALAAQVDTLLASNAALAAEVASLAELVAAIPDSLPAVLV